MSEQRIAQGVYKGRVIAEAVQYGNTKNGHDQIVLDLSLTELGERVSTFLVFSDASAPYSIERLRACGWQGDDLTNLAGIDANEVDVEVKYETWEGELKMRVQILANGGRIVLQQTMNDQAKRAFAAKFRGVAAQARPAGQSSGGSPSGAAPGTSFPFGKNAEGGVKL